MLQEVFTLNIRQWTFLNDGRPVTGTNASELGLYTDKNLTSCTQFCSVQSPNPVLGWLKGRNRKRKVWRNYRNVSGIHDGMRQTILVMYHSYDEMSTEN
jgi:hypothetical protein